MVPIRVSFHLPPVFYFNKECIFSFAQALGQSLKIDSATLKFLKTKCLKIMTKNKINKNTVRVCQSLSFVQVLNQPIFEAVNVLVQIALHLGENQHFSSPLRRHNPYHSLSSLPLLASFLMPGRDEQIWYQQIYVLILK